MLYAPPLTDLPPRLPIQEETITHSIKNQGACLYTQTGWQHPHSCLPAVSLLLLVGDIPAPAHW